MQCQLYNLLLLNWYLLGLELNLGHTHKTRFWYLLGVFLKFSNYPHHFYGEVFPPPGSGPPNYKSKSLNTRPSAPVSLTGQGISCQSTSDCKVEETTGSFSISFYGLGCTGGGGPGAVWWVGWFSPPPPPPPPQTPINLMAHLLGTFEIKMAAHNSKHLICTILRNNRGLQTVYLPPIFNQRDDGLLFFWFL